MSRFVVSCLSVLALFGTVTLASAQGTQDPGPKASGKVDSSSVFVNGMLAVPGAAADAETAPSTVSPRNAASDKLPIAAFRLKHLTDEQRRWIAQTLGTRRDVAIGPAGAADHYVVGSQVPAPVALQELAPLPESILARFPELNGTGFMRAGGKLVLVDLDNSLVVDVLGD